MKRLGILTALAALTVPFVVAVAQARSDEKAGGGRSICHRTGSASRPYVKLRVTAAQMRRHLRHAADIVPAPRGACPRTVLTARSGGRALAIALTGEAEQPAGDPVGTGTATVRLRANQGQLCFAIRAQNITLPSAGAHIHRGSAGESGPIVVPLAAPRAGGTAGGCVAVARSLVRQLLARPAGYYVNVHTTDFPAGAVRGQLTGTSVTDLGRTLTVSMSGGNERPAGAGDPDGTGTATLRFRATAGQLCFRLRVQNILLPAVGAHIHRAPADANGPIVVPFQAPGVNGVSSGCATVDAAVLNEILGNPAGFYVNVHTTERTAGAVRGQLS